MESNSRVLRSRSRKAFELPSAESSQPGTPALGQEAPSLSSSDLLDASKSALNNDSLLPSSSMMNLTSSTLYGIYSPTAFEGSRDDDSGTPWNTGARTPRTEVSSPTIGDFSGNSGGRAAGNSLTRGISEEEVLRAAHAHVMKRHGFRGYILPLLRRSVLLFLFGMAYGGIITHLQSHPTVAERVPVNIENINLTEWSLGYLGLWGVAGVFLGSLQPWFDLFWGDDIFIGQRGRRSAQKSSTGNGLLEWSPIIRSIGAFVGIAFAIRKLPWQSTLQVSLTLALVNPVLWYLIDRSKPGFVLSTIVGLSGMLALLRINPTIVPSPATAQPSAPSAAVTLQSVINGSTIIDTARTMGMTQESIAVGTWIASVLFCGCVCFGNIGRRLADD